MDLYQVTFAQFQISTYVETVNMLKAGKLRVIKFPAGEPNIHTFPEIDSSMDIRSQVEIFAKSSYFVLISNFVSFHSVHILKFSFCSESPKRLQQPCFEGSSRC